jgi:hypothetical protein
VATNYLEFPSLGRFDAGIYHQREYSRYRENPSTQTMEKHAELRAHRQVQRRRYEEKVATKSEEIRQLGKAGWTKYDGITFNGTHMHFFAESPSVLTV